MIVELAKNIRTGIPYKYAASLSGISEASFYAYMAEADKIDKELRKAGREATASESIYLELMEAIKKANADSIKKNLKTIQSHSEKEWQAAAWLLERRDPENFGRRDKLAVTHFTEGELEEADRKIAEIMDRDED